MGLSTENKIQTQSASKVINITLYLVVAIVVMVIIKNGIMLPLDYNFIQMIKITSNITCSYIDDF